MNNSKIILVFIFPIADTLLTITAAVTTMVPAAYAGGDNDDDNGDRNKQKAEDDSSAAIADCDDNDIEQGGFDCIAIAANDVEIEPLLVPEMRPIGERILQSFQFLNNTGS